MTRCPACGRPGYCPACGRSAAARRSTASAKPGIIAFDMIAIAVVALVAGLLMLARLPLVIWHKTGADGQPHPVAATYAAYLISGGVIMAGLMFFSIRAARRRQS